MVLNLSFFKGSKTPGIFELVPIIKGINSWIPYKQVCPSVINCGSTQTQGFDFFIECFTTTFLRAHSWLNWVDEDDDEHDEVGLKEKPEDTRYIKKITSK